MEEMAEHASPSSLEPPKSHDDVLGAVLSGGLSRRMGQDKATAVLGGRTLLARAVDRLEGQVGGLVVNANGDPMRLAAGHVPVVSDVVTGHPGPLAGVLTVLEYAAAQGWRWVVTVPVDTPFLPLDLVDRLISVLRWESAEIACAASNGRVHPIVALWPVELRGDLRRALVEEDLRKVETFTKARSPAIASWSAEPLDPFLNVNSPADLFEVEHGLFIP
jgi:molybdopterin-guanine dinucleotide biosynthesis protein A